MPSGARAVLRVPRMPPAWAGAAMLALAMASTAVAHPFPFSAIDVRLSGSAIEVSVTAHVFDLAHELLGEPSAGSPGPSGLASRAAEIASLLDARLELTADGEPLTLRWLAPQTVPVRQSLRVEAHVSRPAAPTTITLEAALFPYDPNHQTFVNVYEDGVLATQAILDRDNHRLEYFAGNGAGRLALAQKFLVAGIHHILTGLDHILFLVGLLLWGGTLRRLLVVVTAFTLGHSLTLALAALDLVSPRPGLIEPTIALSVVFVGADNLLVRPGGRDVRAWIALVFGLVHGFGFAGVLREAGLPSQDLLWSLLSFNLGVEIGQLGVVVVVSSALAALKASSERAERQLVFIGSWAVAAAGAFWFIERVFFQGSIT